MPSSPSGPPHLKSYPMILDEMELQAAWTSQ
jgi:hypothetical protein